MRLLNLMHPFFILFLSFLFASVVNAQQVHIVNNNVGAPGGVNNYITVSEAITAANIGDIIQIIPSQDGYGDFTVNKSLKIYGIGFNPDKDIPTRSVVGTVTLEHGVSDVTIEGLYLSGILFDSNNSQNENVTQENIRIKKNRFIGRIIYSTGAILQEVFISKNVFTGWGTATYTDIGFPIGNSTADVLISNNIFSRARAISVGGQAIITNNLFLGGGNVAAFYNLTNSTVSNNIFYGSSPVGSTVESTQFQNNLVFGAATNSFPIGENGNTGSDNMEEVNPLFVDLDPTNIVWDFSWDPTLQESSPAKGAGTDGKDIGIFGGLEPFDETGVPLPLIQSLNVPFMIGEGEDLNVTIQARGN